MSQKYQAKSFGLKKRPKFQDQNFWPVLACRWIDPYTLTHWENSGLLGVHVWVDCASVEWFTKNCQRLLVLSICNHGWMQSFEFDSFQEVPGLSLRTQCPWVERWHPVRRFTLILLIQNWKRSHWIFNDLETKIIIPPIITHWWSIIISVGCFGDRPKPKGKCLECNFW